MLTLSEIEQGTYQFILARYLKDFYRCLEKENYSVAKQYLHLMDLSKQYETTSADLTNFEGYLLALEKLQQNQTKILHLKEMSQPKKILTGLYNLP